MRPFIINRHGRMVFPSSYFPAVDLSLYATLEQFERAVQRDFEEKAPTGTDIAERVEQDKYPTRFELLRDLALNLFWVNRYALTMYEKRPTRWRDVPKASNTLFLPVVTPWEDGERKVAAVADAYRRLPPAWDEVVEDRIYEVLFDVFRHKLHHATELPAIKPTIAEIVAQPRALTFRLRSHDPDYPVFSPEEILDHQEDVAELESLGRWAMVLHNQYPWDRAVTELAEVSTIEDDDFVVVFAPRNPDVGAFIRRAKGAKGGSKPEAPAATEVEARQPVRPFPPIDVRRRFAVQPRIEALSAVPGEHPCTNDDVIRNSAFNWSPMTAAQIADKTGIESRRYTERPLEHLALDAAVAAITGSGRSPEEIGAVLVCTCTNARLIPSMASWLSGQLGIFRTFVSCDLVAACAGFPYGLADAVRILQEIERPVLVVFAEKFSDKIGSVRTSRMLFGDGAAAVVLAPTPDGEPGDIEVLQTYASGPTSQVNSIIWPNAEFDGNITVFGPEVKALVERYLAQMIDELKELRSPDGDGHLLDHIDAVVPHQANKVMVSDIATEAGIPIERVYFNIERTGNLSAASIPLAIHDAVVDGVIDRPMRIFCPGFGAGAVAGYAVLHLDPDIVVRDAEAGDVPGSGTLLGASVEDVRLAFS